MVVEWVGGPKGWERGKGKKEREENENENGIGIGTGNRGENNNDLRYCPVVVAVVIHELCLRCRSPSLVSSPQLCGP